jgi:hypothetical protein
LLKANAVSPEGTLYIGDGCWGREGRPITEGGRWYLERASSIPHFWCVDVDATGLAYRAIDARGRVFDVYPEDAPGSVEAGEIYSALPRLYTLPAAWVKIAPWTVDGPGSNRGTSTVTFTNPSKRPLDVTLAPDSAPGGSKLNVPAATTTVAAGASASWPISFEATGGQPIDLEDFQVLVTARGAAGAGAGAETYQDDFDVPPPATK